MITEIFLLILMVPQQTLALDSVKSSCPFFDGLYSSMMRNIYNPGFHKYEQDMCVIIDPLGQTHSPASSHHYIHLFCFTRV